MTPKEVLDAMESAVTAADACYRVNSDREFADHMLTTLRDAGFVVQRIEVKSDGKSEE